MDKFNYDIQGYSPVSDQDDWMKYIKSEDCSDIELNTDIFDTQLDQIFCNDYGSNTPMAPPVGDYKINLSSVNDRLARQISNEYDDTEADNEGGSSSGSSPDNSRFSSFSTPSVSTFSSSKKCNKQPKKRAPRKKLTESQKVAHNIIEKKYRININTKIESLQKLIPSLATVETGFKTNHSEGDVNGDVNGVNKKLNKSAILDRAIEYILALQQSHANTTMENEILKAELAKHMS